MDILELQYEMLSRLSSQCDCLNLTDFQLETGESATDIEAAAPLPELLLPLPVAVLREISFHTPPDR